MQRVAFMIRVGVALSLLLMLVSEQVASADDGAPKLTPAERKQFEDKLFDLSNEGVKHHEANRLPEAVASLEKALAIARQLYPPSEFPGGHRYLAMAVNNLAGMLHVSGKYAESEKLGREGLAMVRRVYGGQDHEGVAHALHQHGVLTLEHGNAAAAEPLLLEALEMQRRLFNGRDHEQIAMEMLHLAHALQGQAKSAGAVVLCRDALEMNQRLFPGRDHPATALSLRDLSIVLANLGKRAEAEARCREALAMERRLSKGKDNPRLGRALDNLGFILWSNDRYDDAEPLFSEELAMQRRMYPKRDHPDLAHAVNNLASTYMFQRKYTLAEPLFRESVEMYRRLYNGKDHPELAHALSNLAAVRSNQAKYAKAEEPARECVAMTVRLFPGMDHPTLIMKRANLAWSLAGQGKHDEADALFLAALNTQRAANASYAAAATEGESLTLAASLPPALDYYLSHVTMKHRDPEEVYREVWLSKANLARFYERRALAARAASADPHAARLLAALSVERRRRADLLLKPGPTDAETLHKRDTDIAERDRAIERLNRDLRPLLPAVGRAEKLAQSTPTDLRKLLPPDTAVVDFLHYYRTELQKGGNRLSSHYVAFVITRDRITGIDLDTAERIESVIADWRVAITSGKQIPPAVPSKVRELVWAKVHKALPAGIKTVYLCPDLALCRLPWAALPGDRPGSVLLEDYAVAVLPHATFLLDKLWPAESLAQRTQQALIVGGIAYDAELPKSAPNAALRGQPPVKADGKLVWQPLPGTMAETHGVELLATKKKLPFKKLEDAKATPAALLTALPKARYAHLATHGFFADTTFRSVLQLDPRLFQISSQGERIGAGALSPLVMTGVVLAGANQPDAPGRGIITGEALVDLDLSGLELAVLSACETGLGDVAGGEGTFGLQRAFHLAGTRDVIASLWKVPDRPTAALMALFYRNLWDKEMSPVEALRQAQLEIYRHPELIAALAEGFRGNFTVVPGTAEQPLPPGRNGKSHPRLWAAFTLSGPGR
jgi:CHAT domain-containing protein/tetratricopeptide (TPR) repeat protein